MSIYFCRCGSINLLVYLLVIFFGVSSWVDINGLWIELPILVQHLPEGWDLPSYMSVVIQIANIAPLIYTVISAVCPHRMLEVPVIYTIICLGAVACLLLAFLWQETSYIAGRERSTALLVLQFFLALVDCTSSVAFLPFMSAYKPQYMTAYFIGEGFSGLIPSLVAMAQGAGNTKCVKIPKFQNQTSKNDSGMFTNMTQFGFQEFDFKSEISLPESTRGDTNNTLAESSFSLSLVHQKPRFSVQIFFVQLMVLMIISALSFTLLNFWSYCKREKVHPSSELSRLGGKDINAPISLIDDSCNKCTHLELSTPLTDGTDTQIVHPNQTASIGYNIDKRDHVSNNHNNSYIVETTGDSINLTSSFVTKFSETDKASEEGEFPARTFKPRKMSRMKYGVFLLTTALMNAISNSLLPSIQTYSCIPYGIEQYHLSITLTNIANPVACFASFLLKMKSLKWTLLMTLIGIGLSGYLVWTASTSPMPPLINHTAGPVILILCWILVVFVITYTKVSIATEFREEGRRALLWCGASSQAGSLVGAISTFVAVNVFEVFQAGNPCA